MEFEAGALLKQQLLSLKIGAHPFIVCAVYIYISLMWF
jgi:hypothetical protein